MGGTRRLTCTYCVTRLTYLPKNDFRQAMLSHRGSGGPRLYVQPWLDLIVDLGHPRFEPRTVPNPYDPNGEKEKVGEVANGYGYFTRPRLLERGRGSGGRGEPGVRKWGGDRFGSPRQLFNHSATWSTLGDALRTWRFSPTSNLLLLDAPVGSRHDRPQIAENARSGLACRAYLGVGHVHRRSGWDSARQARL